MKILLYISFLLSNLLLLAQEDSIYGIVKDSASLEPMIAVHVQNINKGVLTYSNPQGEFRIPASIGDTLVLSSIGYKTFAWIVESSWFHEDGKVFLLPVNTIYLDEVVVGKLPSYSRFMDNLMDIKVEDSAYAINGVPRVVITEKESLNGSLNVRGPFSLIHNKFSKRAGEQKKLKKLLDEQSVRDKTDLKFTREWVSKTMNMEGDKLTSFIEYCNFSLKYIAETPQYIIYEDMMALLPKFLKEYEDQS